jgi:hypothetical protein
MTSLYSKVYNIVMILVGGLFPPQKAYFVQRASFARGGGNRSAAGIGPPPVVQLKYET